MFRGGRTFAGTNVMGVDPDSNEKRAGTQFLPVYSLFNYVFSTLSESGTN
jgi:hypothetical protein